MSKGILSKVRDEGYREGWAQASQVRSDDDYARGREDAWANEPGRLRWFVLGMMSVAIVGLFV